MVDKAAERADGLRMHPLSDHHLLIYGLTDVTVHLLLLWESVICRAVSRVGLTLLTSNCVVGSTAVCRKLI